MIASAFLLCALAAPGMSFAQPAHTAKVNGNRIIIDSAAFAQRMLRNERRVLIVGGNVEAVTVFRRAGMQAFGILTEDRPTWTPYHAVANAGALPFASGSFQTVFWDQPNTLKETEFCALKDATRLVEPMGYFFFDPDENPYWTTWLTGWQWDRLPFRLGQFAIYQRPSHNGDAIHFGRSA